MCIHTIIKSLDKSGTLDKEYIHYFENENMKERILSSACTPFNKPCYAECLQAARRGNNERRCCYLSRKNGVSFC